MASPGAIEEDYDVPGLDPPISLESLYSMSHSHPSQFDQYRPSTPVTDDHLDALHEAASPNMMAYLQFTPQRPMPSGSSPGMPTNVDNLNVHHTDHGISSSNETPTRGSQNPFMPYSYGFLTPKLPALPAENSSKSSPLFSKRYIEQLDGFQLSSSSGFVRRFRWFSPAPIISSLLNEHIRNWPPLPSLHRSYESGRSLKRSRSLDDDLSGDEHGASDDPGTSLNVIYSPLKGRRLKLLHGGPEEEDQQAVSTQLVRVREDAPSTPEDAAVLERRVAAFSRRVSPSPSGFIPVQWPGRGRVLMSSRPIDPEHPTEDGEGDNFLVARKEELTVDIPLRPSMATPPIDIEAIRQRLIQRVSWPDSEFPWNHQKLIRAREDAVMMRLKEAFIREWFEGESDEEDDGDEDEDDHYAEGGLSRSRQLLITNGKSAESADARDVLLAQHNAFLTKRTRAAEKVTARQNRNNSDDDDIKCVCNGGEDMGPMVCCDECSTWYHQHCMGIEHESDLGEHWYCADCEARRTAPPQPVLVPNVELPPCRPSSPQQPLYQTPLTPESRRNKRRQPRTPRRIEDLLQTPENRPSKRDLDLYYVYGSRRVEMARGASSTPQASGSGQVLGRWITPGNAFEDTGRPVQRLGDSPFNPLSTPSRGLKFAVPLVAKTGGNQDMLALRASLFSTPQSRVNRHAMSRRPVEMPDSTPQSIHWTTPFGFRRVRRRVDHFQEFGGELNVADDIEQTPLRYEGMIERRSPTPDHVISAQDLEEYGMEELDKEKEGMGKN